MEQPTMCTDCDQQSIPKSLFCVNHACPLCKYFKNLSHDKCETCLIVDSLSFGERLYKYGYECFYQGCPGTSIQNERFCTDHLCNESVPGYQFLDVPECGRYKDKDREMCEDCMREKK